MGNNGSVSGVINLPGKTLSLRYTGQSYFITTSGGTNYWNPSTPYVSAMVGNPPPASDIIAISDTSMRTLTFSEPVQNLFLAFVSLNGNGYKFNHDFEIVSTGRGYWGDGTVVREDLGGNLYELRATSNEPHGVIRFKDPVSSLSWTCNVNENWHGFTVGTYNVPEPGSCVVLGGGLMSLLGYALRRKRS
ncbi:MAG: PEP-CTERM sorting domain-containing protein [Armatimonadota bacterium]